ncbi:hypothetical protein P5V15_014662 [Pogonomyrmex californicus]
MEEEQFFMVLPSDSSKKYFPGNTCSSFTTQLPHSVHLFGKWEVALSGFNFPSLFHVRRRDNKAGVYENTEDLIYAINKECRRSDSHFTFELQKGSGGNVRISIDCDDNCTLVHYINLPANIFQILKINIDDTGTIYRHKLPNSDELTPFLKLSYVDAQYLSGLQNPVVYGTVSLIKCTFIATFASLT